MAVCLILFYKIKALHKHGIKIHLHCFEYGRGQQPVLNEYCEEVFYYKRKRSLSFSELRLPYIVSSRKNDSLLNNLKKDNYPILLEGIHCTYYLYDGQLTGRRVLVRMHNVEYQYYNELSKSANNVLKKVYYFIESRLLKRYEKAIANKAKLLAVNEKDKHIYQEIFSAKDVDFLPVFLPFDRVESRTGKGTFCLYHGNLSVEENEKAAIWLIEHVFFNLDIPLVIAGKNPSASLKKNISEFPNITLLENPSSDEMEELIKNAHIHLIPSFNSTGIKIKMLNALFNGRFVITNSASVEGTGLQTLCDIAETANEYIEKTRKYFQLPFTENEIEERKKILKSMYDNEKNVLQLMKWL